MTKQLEGQLNFADLGLPYGKTSPVPSRVTKAKTSGQSSRHLQKSETQTCQYLFLRKVNGKRPDSCWETVTASRGEPMMRNFGESPRDVRESTLSQILVPNAPTKYSLTPKACQGILRRAERRGKELPPMLRMALEEVARQAS